jgi:hypothetical protein
VKSRMFVVDSTTLISTQASNIATLYVPSLTTSLWLKTIVDMMADLLQIEIGDYIFLWEKRDGTQKSRIHGVYRAISKPFYQCNSPTDHNPLKIYIERAYVFLNPIDEYDLLNHPYIKTLLWTIIGKKVAGKSRGTSPLSPEEARYIISLLIGKNPSFTFNPPNSATIVTVANPLCIDYSLHNTKPTTPRGLATFNPSTTNFFSPNYELFYEKTLETIFNQEMTARNNAFYSQLGIQVNKVIWYSNYLPYSLEQSEMDYVIYSSEDAFVVNKIHVLEFMIDRIDEDHINRALLYSKWVNDTLGFGASICEPILICKSSVDFINGETTPYRLALLSKWSVIIRNLELVYGVKPLQIYEYSFISGAPTFTRKK